MTEVERFEGHPNRECGDHRTLGGRAWCSTCSTYCYPEAPCPGCEVPMLRAENERLEADLETAIVGLEDCSTSVYEPTADDAKSVLAALSERTATGGGRPPCGGKQN